MLRRGQRTALAAAAASALALSVTGPLAAAPGAEGAGDVASKDDAPVLGGAARDRKGYYDQRQVGPSGEVVAATKVLEGPSPAKVAVLQEDLGPSAVIDIDPLTGTPSNLTRLNGFLTAPTSRSADSVVQSYLASNASALGLTRADLSTFDLRKDYVDVVGTHHLSYTQSAHGVNVFGNGLEAHVTKSGQLISVQGSPIAGLSALTANAGTTPQLSASAARERAARDVGGTVGAGSTQGSSTGEDTQWTNGDNARLVWFVSATGPRLAWATYTQAGDTLDYSHVIDARSGAVLYRRDLVDHDQGDARVYDYYPGADRGGDAKVVNFLDQGWLGRRATWLTGESVTAWADVNDDNAVSARERTPVPGTDRRAQFTLQPFNDASKFCGRSYVCTWDHNEGYSWRVNENADVTNAFYLASNFHDYLARPPIGFNARAGNFERAGNDQVLLHALDGANTATDENGDPIGFPDGNHVDNANMSTPPDGTAPTMQMYLFRFPGATIQQDPFLPVSSSFDATILYHEYTHGLSNRLVVDADGNSTLNSIQANAMGEAWSDWYAMDYLVARGFQPDSQRDGQVGVGEYTLAGQEPFRTMPMDCDPDSTTARCLQIDGATRGGYTYGDFPRIGGAPQVHASGEVWAQTLWDIREAVGHRVADMLVTRGMELSSNDPSMLDMRNAILQADKVAYGSNNTRQLWRIFANRGMGWFAGSIDAGDVNPAEDFHTPPSPTRGYGTVAGYVLNRLTGRPISGARVTITGHPEYSDRTGADGIYQIDNVLPGRYQKVVLKADGYELVAKRVRVAEGFTQEDFSARRDWAARSGGASIADYNGPDYTDFGCGPEGAIDLSQGTGWGSTTGDDNGTPTADIVPKFIVVELPRAIDVASGDGGRSAFAVDPTAVCGDAGSASTGNFTIEVAQNADGPFTRVAMRRGESNWLPRFQFSNVAADQDLTGVQYVRFTIRSPQVPDFATNCPDGAYDGCSFMDLTELEVFGTRTGTAPAAAAPKLEPLR